nr:hypothetical protein [Tanacetum cinerariifolium]
MNPNEQSKDSSYAPYPKIDPNDVAPPPPVTNTGDSWTSVPVGSQQPFAAGQMYTGGDNSAARTGEATTMPHESNPYVSPAPVPESSTKKTIDTVKDVLGKWGKKAADATKKGQDYAGEMWQHLKTGPSITDAAVGRIAQGTKALAEGGYEKIFATTFETVPDEKLLKYYPCYLSTSADTMELL